MVGRMPQELSEMCAGTISELQQRVPLNCKVLETCQVWILNLRSPKAFWSEAHLATKLGLLLAMCL